MIFSDEVHFVYNHKRSLIPFAFQVKLASQVMNSSVAKSLQLASALQIRGFEDVRATVYFIAKIDRLFDILNSRAPLGKGFKAPINGIQLRCCPHILQRSRRSLQFVVYQWWNFADDQQSYWVHWFSAVHEVCEALDPSLVQWPHFAFPICADLQVQPRSYWAVLQCRPGSTGLEQ